VAQLEKEMRMMRSLLKGRIREESEPESEGSEVDDRDLEGDGELKTMRDHSAHSSDRYMDYSPELMNTHPGGHDRVPFSGPPSFAGLPPGFEMEETPPVEDVIDRGILSLEDAEQLVAYFIHELAYFFPLVVLPLNTTAAQLRQTKPVLFLSVIAATSISVDAGLAAVLNREMVRLYSERFFIEGEKSLELVQALLLMIIFYFPPASPLKLQFYQYTHIASTMALEIGLANKRRVSKKSDRKNRLEPHDELLAEQARAVLGCYHLGSTVAMKTRRQNLLQFNDWVTECVKHLEHSPHRTDQHLAVWFELQRITDEAMSSFGLDDTSATSPLTESRVQAVLRWFDKRMDIWKKNTPSAMLTGKSFSKHPIPIPIPSPSKLTPPNSSSNDPRIPLHSPGNVRTRRRRRLSRPRRNKKTLLHTPSPRRRTRKRSRILRPRPNDCPNRNKHTTAYRHKHPQRNPHRHKHEMDERRAGNA
jgi:hypothetical protein